MSCEHIFTPISTTRAGSDPRTCDFEVTSRCTSCGTTRTQLVDHSGTPYEVTDPKFRERRDYPSRYFDELRDERGVLRRDLLDRLTPTDDERQRGRRMTDDERPTT